MYVLNLLCVCDNILIIHKGTNVIHKEMARQKLSFHYKRLSKKFTRKEKTKQKIRKEFEGYHVYIIVSAMFRYEICLIMKVCLEFYMKEENDLCANERLVFLHYGLY